MLVGYGSRPGGPATPSLHPQLMRGKYYEGPLVAIRESRIALWSASTAPALQPDSLVVTVAAPEPLIVGRRRQQGAHTSQSKKIELRIDAIRESRIA